jgi:hypothetical protein
MCIVLRPCTTGVVLKWKIIVVLPFRSAKLSAEIPFTVKSLACTVVGSTASLTSIMKSVGWLNITSGQEVVTEQPVGVGVGVGVPAGPLVHPPIGGGPEPLQKY